LSDVTFFDPIQSSILLVEQRMRTQADGFHPELKSALTHLLSAGGKRIRVAVALLVGGMFKADQHRLITLAAAIELLHTATLVHDDLIDGALMRRGNPTLNARWTPAATVLTGDFLFAQAANLAADTKSVRVIKLFTETLATICDGEVTQMFERQFMSDFKGYEKRIYAKTASLFETGAFSAAILSDVPEQTAQDFKQYGYEIGMAFQIVDDILDYTGEQSTVGKPVASDLRQGIMTLPVLFFLEQVKQDPVVTAILDARRVSEEQIQRLLVDIRACGAVDRAIQEANRHIQAAIGILSGYPICTERLALEELARFISQRSK
jgi:geranylgeranyl pyrophosphate synthase